ncbi:tRNA (adenine(22)-N(1))-methyltransferase TrmK [Oceanobacillus sp. 143]|uniref:tRNA (Adenine(22)-N(1))-methyltransferase TrmK n=1 Tax=Oceanobacillus zhaokaii TaxID=2052660 RepID=A0A345PHJ6_9BACI|nr:tRNA (adenine(22)-N(1))-methyltransferase TrmK [Oceanobacillus zhaokaii]AXI09476.1 tRNA (adenine(22)-N(1))-methyltransferase TrmK [Oceanobacillus zhaokaii]QGS68879.1 tRNA (adenine(22)-N(1))-methyltransferase TrmK [Oceanobacillus sp. 143]
MTQTLNLSKRLTKVASYLPKGAKFADIGSDHAYLPCYVCLQDKSSRAIAGEVNEGPFKSAIKTVEYYQLNESIEVRLGNGLGVLNNLDNVEQIVIAGMGGALIKSILEEGKSKVQHVKRIIAQPNIDARNVRKWFNENGFIITSEEVVEENQHIYEIIVADKVEWNMSKQQDLDPKQLFFGPLLLENKTKEFFEKWSSEHEKTERIIKQIKKAKVKDERKLKQFEEELIWIKEVLDHEA